MVAVRELPVFFLLFLFLDFFYETILYIELLIIGSESSLKSRIEKNLFLDLVGKKKMQHENSVRIRELLANGK